MIDKDSIDSWVAGWSASKQAVKLLLEREAMSKPRTMSINDFVKIFEDAINNGELESIYTEFIDAQRNRL